MSKLIRQWGRLVFAAGLAVAAGMPGVAGAQEFPGKPVRIVVGYAPGGGTDVTARILASGLQAKWNQQVLVENRSGASGMIAGEAVARAAPDGLTLLLGYTPEVSINKLIFRQMTYDPIADLQPVALVSTAALFLVSGPKTPVASMQELLARGKAGASFSYGSPGTGGQQHLAGELLQIVTGLKLVHVPYRGAAPAVTDLVGGQFDIFFSTPPVVLPHIKSGKLRPLFVTSPTRDRLMPEVPSAAEVGLPEFDIANWFGVFGPRGMDAGLVQRISADVGAALQDPGVSRRIEEQGLTVRYMNARELQAFIATEMKKYGSIIERSGLPKQ